jgi:hypothetical protein
MSSICTEINLKDRVFVTRNGAVRERRYQNGNWVWIDHTALNDFLGGKGTVLGPCLVNTTENVGRLYIRVGDTRAFSGPTNLYVTGWVMYNFNPWDTDYSDFSNFQIGSYEPIMNKTVNCSTNFSVSADWKLYGMAQYYPTSSNAGAIKKLQVTRFDIDLNVIAQSTDGMPRFFVDDGRSYDSKYITEGDAKNVRLAIMSDHDVFASSGEHLHMANIHLGVSQHSDKDILDTGGSGFEDKVFAMGQNGNLFARRFDHDKHKWVWDKHGCPVKKKHFRKYVVGSMRRMNQGLLFLIKPKWANSDDNFRVYHRWQDTDGSWHWADHGYPDNETVCEIGPAWDNKFFVRTTSGKLYERHWNSNVEDWAWENHGTL